MFLLTKLFAFFFHFLASSFFIFHLCSKLTFILSVFLFLCTTALHVLSTITVLVLVLFIFPILQ